MTESILESLGMRLLEQELKSNRCVKEHYKRMMKSAGMFIGWARARGCEGLDKIRRADIIRYQSWLGNLPHRRTGKPIALSTVKHHYNAVLKLFSVLYRAGAVAENPTHVLELCLPGGNRAFKRRPLSRAEITLFLESIPTGDSRGLRSRAFFELVYSSGLRVSEAVNLKVGNIDFTQRQLVVRGKYDRERLVPLSDIARDFLLRYLGARKDAVDDYVFLGRWKHAPITKTTISRTFREQAKACGMDRKELCTHSIRHSTATHLLDNGAGLRHVQELLGHKSIESTALYTHVQSEGLARVYRKYHPREHELFEMVDEAYNKRLDSILNDRYGHQLTGESQNRREGMRRI